MTSARKSLQSAWKKKTLKKEEHTELKAGIPPPRLLTSWHSEKEESIGNNDDAPQSSTIQSALKDRPGTLLFLKLAQLRKLKISCRAVLVD